MNKIYELLREAAGLETIEEGQSIEIRADYLLAHDGSMPKIIKSLGDKVDKVPEENYKKLFVTVDHFIPAPTIEAREKFIEIRDFSRKNGVNLYSQGEGILHQVFAEEVGEDMIDSIVLGVDGHMTTSAGMGALAFSINADEMVEYLIRNKYEIVVPEIVKINLQGEKLDPLASAKDLVFDIISKIGNEGVKAKGILILGEALKSLNKSQKMTIGNILGENGAKTVYFDENKMDISLSDYNINLDEVEALIIDPEDNKAKPASYLNKENITEVFIGGCTNGRIEDMHEIAEILKDNTIKEDLSLIICPASRNVANEMDEKGLSKIIRDSGGIIINPGCGACSGIHQGVISKDDIIVTTTPRNTSGRMGDKEGKIYLASPKTAASIALKR